MWYVSFSPLFREKLMPLVDPNHPLADLLQRDQRYSLDAYLFILEALSFAQESLGMGDQEKYNDPQPSRGKKKSEKHVSGQELCEAARQYAQQQYGYLATKVLGSWGICATADFGEIVFNMIDIGQMRKTSDDSRDDFHDVYSFEDAFMKDVVFALPESL
jgi:uncharacterized repeat protein (TIGR04138 family)